MIIPIGHEQTKVRRLPWVTFGIMILCLIIFLVSLPTEVRGMREIVEIFPEALDYFANHPYLELEPRFRDLLVRQYGEQGLSAGIEQGLAYGPRPPELESELLEQQQHLNALVKRLFDVIEGSPSFFLGVVPANLTVHGLVTHQFVHAGWLHLIFNMIFLFVMGPFIEDVWGRPLYLGFYVLAGVFAALMFVVRYPDFQGPLIGASGAIAGVMGAFLVRFAKTKVRFILWLVVPIGPFSAPAWVIFPFWFLFQLFMARFMDSLLPGQGGGGVAFWAHVWGFVFGVIVAYTMAHFSIEERFLHPSIESKVTLIDNTAVESAVQLADGGDLGASFAALERELAADPDNLDAAMAMWNLGFKHNQIEPAIPHMLTAMRSAVRRGEHDFVESNWQDMLNTIGSIPVDSVLGLQIAEIFERARRDDPARDTLALAFKALNSGTPAAILLRMARLAVVLQSPDTAAIVDFALANPEIPPDARAELEAARAEAPEMTGTLDQSRATVEISQAEDDEPDVEEIVHVLRTMSAIPRKVDGTALSVEIRGEIRSVTLDSIQALAVAGINRSGEKPIVLVDLLLDSPWGDRPAIRCIRLMSNTFDPRPLVGIDDAMKAFQKFLGHLLDISEAVPLPDPGAARGDPFRSYPSIEVYQQEVLSIASS